MKHKLTFLIAVSTLALALVLRAAPAPSPTPSRNRVPVKKVTPTPRNPPNYHKDPMPPPKPFVTPKPKPFVTPKPKTTVTPKPTPNVTPKAKPNVTPTPNVTPKPTLAPAKPPWQNNPPPTPTSTFVPIKIPGKDDTKPTPSPTSTIAGIKIPGKGGPTPSPTPTPKKSGPGSSATPSPTPKILVPGKKITPTPSPDGDKDKHTDKKDVHVWTNIDVVPSPPSLLGPPPFLVNPPAYHPIRPAQTFYLSEGVAPVPSNYVAPPPNAPIEISPTALRAWNGQEPPGRAFDQTRVKVLPARNGTVPWQFCWKTTGSIAQAARWEVATVPFVAGVTTFPPAGLVGYGDASINLDSPLSENFFAVDCSSFSKNFAEGFRPNKYYMRVVPIDQEGNPVGSASNFVRIDFR